MLCDECILACLIPLSVPGPEEVMPAMLDKQKSNGDSIVSIVETILHNHQQSGHYCSGDEHLHELKLSLLNAKVKKIDMSCFYAF
jgi:hypothetical protein